MRIAVRELKASLSRVLACAQAGEIIEVTSRRKLIARITGVPTDAASGLRELIRTGVLSWNGTKPGVPSREHLASGGVAVSRGVIEDRG